MQEIEWLCPIQNATITSVKYSAMASLRLRSSLCSEIALQNGITTRFTDGNDSSSSKDIYVGKIDVITDPTREFRWLKYLDNAKTKGSRIIIDYTDNHIFSPTKATNFYINAINLADIVICSSEELARQIKFIINKSIVVIEDPVETPVKVPKTTRNPIPKGLWFGHASNLGYLIDYLIHDYPKSLRLDLIVMSNLYPFPSNYLELFNATEFENLNISIIPWELNDMIKVSNIVDFCIIPAGVEDPRKIGASSNRLLTAFALGLPVAADNLASYLPFKQYYANLRSKEFIHLINNVGDFKSDVLSMQNIIANNYTKTKLGEKWLKVLKG